jgi:menaquinone-dependent protoporphyrinogen oxidase
MNILLLYATTEGQTRKIAEFAANRLRGAGDNVAMIEAGAASQALDLAPFDGAILAASLHVGQYQKPLVAFARQNHEWLNRTPSAFLSVSLAAVDSDAEELKSLAFIADNFKAYTGWTAAEIHHVAGAFRFSEYDFFKRWVMRLVSWEKSIKVKPGENLELTDWNALGATVDALRARFADKAASHAA